MCRPRCEEPPLQARVGDRMSPSLSLVFSKAQAATAAPSSLGVSDSSRHPGAAQAQGGAGGGATVPGSVQGGVVPCYPQEGTGPALLE